MQNARLSLLVLRASDLEACVPFYEALGFKFHKHSHGKGPEHYASEADGFVFEIYPLAGGQTPTTMTRIGFQVSDVDAAARMLLLSGGKMLSEPSDSEWGRRCVIVDPEGHRVELTHPNG